MNKLTPVRIREEVHAVLGFFYEILAPKTGISPVRLEHQDARRAAIVSLAAALAAHHAGNLTPGDSRAFSVETPACGPLEELLQLCPLPLQEVLERLSAAGWDSLSRLLIETQATSFENAIEIIWPESLHFAPQALHSSSTVYRRRQGAYLTPRWLARRTIELTVMSYLRNQDIDTGSVQRTFERQGQTLSPETRTRLGRSLHDLRIVDPACGAGTFLAEAFRLLLTWQKSLVPRVDTASYAQHLIIRQLYGVDRDPLSVALTKVVLWFQANPHCGPVADPLNVHCGDALLGRPFHGTWDRASISHTVTDSTEALDWTEAFPKVAQLGGFDIVVGNPPWERVKALSREFFEIELPAIAAAPTTAARERMMGEHKREFQSRRAQRRAYAQAVRSSGYFGFTAAGDLNLYPLFVERAMQIANKSGHIGLLVPSGLATDLTLSPFFTKIREDRHLVFFLDFENRARVFPDVDSRYRFSICVLTNATSSASPEYSFFLHDESYLDDPNRRLLLDESTIALVNPNTRTLPVVRTQKDLAILVRMHKQAPILEYDAGGEQDWEVQYRRLFDMTNDSDKFLPWSALSDEMEIRPDGLVEDRGRRFAPVYEGRMIGTYDHRAASCIERVGNFRRPAASLPTTEAQYQDPEHTAIPRYLVPAGLLEQRLGEWDHPWFIGFKDIGSATNRRTMIASVLPLCAAGNKVPLLLPQGGAEAGALLLANLNSFAFDYALRQHIGNITLNWFIVRQCPVIPQRVYHHMLVDDERLDRWVQRRVLELTYTSTSLGGWARALGYQGRPYQWDRERRRKLCLELNALFFALYGLDEADIMQVMASFLIVRRTEEKKYGEYRLRREIADQVVLTRYSLSTTSESSTFGWLR